MKHCSNERFLIVLDIINNAEPKYEKLRSLIQLPVRECKHGHPLFYAEHVLFYQYGHPILCRTRLILPVWSPLYYAQNFLFYQSGHPCIMHNTFYSTSMVTLYYAEHACPLHSLIKWNSIGKFIKVPSHAQHRAVVCQACKRHNAPRITDISPMLWICQTTLDELQ
jgi:hypothetical protein